MNMKRKNGDSRQNPVFEEKKKYRSANMITDPKLIPRVRQYLDVNKQKQVISVIAMADDIQARYSRDYGRKKKNAFRISVEKAYEVILTSQKADTYSKLESKHLEKKMKTAEEHDSEDSSLDSEMDTDQSFSSDNPDYTIHKDTNGMNSFLANMYKKPPKGSLEAGSHSNPPSIGGSAPSTPKTQTADLEESLFLIDRKGDIDNLNTPKTRSVKSHSGSVISGSRSDFGSCPGSPARSSRAATPTKVSAGQNQKRPNQPAVKNSNNTEVIVIDGEQTNSKTSAEATTEHVPVTERNDSKQTKSHQGRNDQKTPMKRNELAKDDRSTKKKRPRTGEKQSSEKKDPKTKEMPIPTVTFADVGGNTTILTDLCKLLVHMKHPEVYERLGVTPPRGFLLHGPPGCGKTLLAHAIAGELELPFLKVAATELVSGVSGESEEKIRETFESACASAPCILFLDEIDAITPKRETASKDMERRIVSQLLTCMDDLNSKPHGQVLVIGATNRPDSLDPALRRAGRFDREIGLGIPDEDARQRILIVLCRDLRLAPDFDFLNLARNTPGYVGADLMALARESAIVAVNRVFKKLQTSKDPATSDIHTNPGSEQTRKCSDEVTGTNVSVIQIDSCTDTNTVTEGVTSLNSDPCKSISDLQSDVTATSPNLISSNTANDLENKSSLVKESSCTLSENTTAISTPKQTMQADLSLPRDQVVGLNAEKASEGIDSEFRLVLTWLKERPPLSEDQLANLFITWEDFQEALQYVQPSAKREGFATIPDVTWDDIGALKEVREELQMSILAPVRHPEQFKSLGLTNPPGILLAGPPGCGKTLLAKAVANESGINFISVKGPELLNMYVGESERAVRQVFQRARNSSPCVIFFDELDALCPRRSNAGESGASVRVVNQLLTEMDGLETRKQVFIMGATNRPDIIDPAVLRPGRLDKLLYVGLPTADDRLDILKTITKNGSKPSLSADVDLKAVASHSQCEGFTGADLAALVREASVAALKEFMSQSQASLQPIVVMMAHFDLALKKVRPSVTSKDQLLYEKMKDRITIS